MKNDPLLTLRNSKHIGGVIFYKRTNALVERIKRQFGVQFWRYLPSNLL